jgi:hypothetical protein
MKECFRLTSRGLLFAATLLLIVSTTALTAQAGTPQATAQSGTAQAGPGQEVVASQLPTMTADQMAGAKESPVARNPHFTDAGYQAAKIAASQATVGSRPLDAPNAMMPSNSGADVASLTPGLKVNVLGQLQGCNGLGWTPSDMGLAVSPGFVVQTVNQCFSVYNKSGALLLGPIDLCTFFGRAPNSGVAGCFDPRAIYDYQRGKFIVIASFQFGTAQAPGEGFIDIAASSTSNPTGTWIIHHLDMGAALPDYPTIGQTANNNNTLNSVITVCTNLFGNNGSFTDLCSFLPKKKVYALAGFGFPVVFNFSLGGLLLNTLQPANVFETEENPRAQYAINSVNFNGTDGFCAGGADHGLVVWAFSDATGAQGVKFSGLWTGCASTSGYLFPGNADNAGFCASCIETIDNRITGTVHYASGRLYPSIDANNGGRSAVLGWVVRPFLSDNGAGCTGGVNCATITGANIEQEWCYDCGGGNAAEAFFGAQVPTPENDWTMFATFSNTAISPGMFLSSTRVSFPTFPHDGGFFTCQNNAAYTQVRWGDYAAAAPDIPGKGNIPGTWGSGMFIQAGNGRWGTCISENRPSDGP